ncbi:hypothetical protein NC651_012081 [Populus alba x Populus x berolinensis]|nr:hypothetical protein NC651_012081 [Populus alba x Populus x berolinensis]
MDLFGVTYNVLFFKCIDLAAFVDLNHVDFIAVSVLGKMLKTRYSTCCYHIQYNHKWGSRSEGKIKEAVGLFNEMVWKMEQNGGKPNVGDIKYNIGQDLQR